MSDPGDQDLDDYWCPQCGPAESDYRERCTTCEAVLITDDVFAQIRLLQLVEAGVIEETEADRYRWAMRSVRYGASRWSEKEPRRVDHANKWHNYLMDAQRAEFKHGAVDREALKKVLAEAVADEDGWRERAIALIGVD